MNLRHSWERLPKTKRQAAIRQTFRDGWPPSVDYIQLVLNKDRLGVCASTGPHYIDAVFGRDSLEVAEDLLETHQTLAHDILITLANLQGSKLDPISEEEPGKIHHEYRAALMGGETIPKHSLELMHILQRQWGGVNTDRMVYYGSHDATLLFIRLIGRYVDLYGPQILQQRVNGSGQIHTLSDSVLAAVRWLVAKIDPKLGLFVYRRLNPIGLANQTWKDSDTSFMFKDGGLPDFDKGIAALELQGYAYDALQAAVRLQLGDDQERQNWQNLAIGIQQATIAKLWMSDRHFFAQGLAYDRLGQLRQLDTLTSDAGVLLDTDLLHDLPNQQSRAMIEGIVHQLCGPDFLTKIGIRCRSLEHWHLPGYIVYHGSNVVWPKETFDVSKGLRRSGFADLANTLEDGLLDSLEQSGGFYEFFYVSRDGFVWYDRRAALEHFSEESPGQTLPMPETGQAWTISAAEHILYERSLAKNRTSDHQTTDTTQTTPNGPESRA